MQENSSVTVLEGQVANLGVSVSEVSLTDRPLFWIAASSTESPVILLHKDTAEGEIAVNSEDRAIISLLPEDTAGQPERTYRHELWVIDPDGENVPLLGGEISVESTLIGASPGGTVQPPEGAMPVSTLIELNGRYERSINLRGSIDMEDWQDTSLLAAQALDIIVDVEGVDLQDEGRTLWWVAASGGTGETILRFSLADRITIVDDRTCRISLMGEDTQDHGGQVFRHELWMLDYDGSPTPLMRGEISVIPSLLGVLRASATIIDATIVHAGASLSGGIAIYPAAVTINADIVHSGARLVGDMEVRPESVIINADIAHTGAQLSGDATVVPADSTINADIMHVGAQLSGGMTVLPPPLTIDADIVHSGATLSGSMEVQVPATSILPLSVTAYDLESGSIATFVATGGVPDTYVWSVSGADADKFLIDPNTGDLGIIAGTAPGLYSIVVTANNGLPSSFSANVSVELTAASAPDRIIAATPVADAQALDVVIQLSAPGASPGVDSWSLGGTDAAEVALSSGGLLTVPGDISIGEYLIDIGASNEFGSYVAGNSDLIISEWAPVASLSPTTLPDIENTFAGDIATLTAFGHYPDDLVFSLVSPPAGFSLVSGRTLHANGTQAPGAHTLSIRTSHGFEDGVPYYEATFPRQITVTSAPAGGDFLDTFDGRAGQNLNTNTAWTQISGPADAAYTNSAGELVFNGSTSNSATYLAPNLGYLSHGVEITGVYSTGVGTWSYLAQVCYRYENGSTVAWAGIRHILQNSVYELRLDVWNGALTTVAAYNVGGVLDNDTLRIEKKQLAGSVEISVYLDNVLVLGPWTSTDPKLQNNTRAGLSSRGPNARIGNYRHYEIGAAGTSFVSDAVLHSYLMDEGSGQYVLDSGGASNDSILGTTTGADVNDPAWTATGLNFNTDDLIASEVAHPATAEFHIDLVAKWDTSQNLAWRQAYNHWAGQDSTSAIQIFTDASGIIRAAFSSSGGNINLVHSKPTGAHQHIQAWRDASNVYLAVDGAIVSGVPIGTAGTSSGTIYHGAKYSGANHMLGTSEVSISHRHSRALTAAERAQNREHVIAVMAARGVTLVDEVREPVATLDFNMSDRVFSQVPNLALVSGTESGRVVANQGELYGTSGFYLHSTTALGAAQYVQAKIISINATADPNVYLQPLFARGSADAANGLTGRYSNGKYQISKRVNGVNTTVAEVAKAFVANGILRIEVRDVMNGSTWAGVEARLFLDDKMLMPPVTLTEAVFQTALRVGIRGYNGGFFDDWEAGNIVDAPAETVVSLTAVSESNQVGTVTAVKMEQRLWPSNPTPATVTVDDPAGVELGIKFQASVSGRILGIRFYKGIENTGTHVGNLWNASGTNLGTVNFADETASGWQEMNFASPIPISANTTYVASYYAPVGKYSSNSAYFTTALTSADLTALSSADAGGNGVYSYATSSAFPSSSFNDTNYWVDVIFEPDNDPRNRQ